jgi:prevent-host-death family protein
MTIHVNIAEAKAKLSSLVEASLRGEEVILARAGEPKVRLVALPEAVKQQREERRRKLEELLAKMDAIPDREDWVDPLQWDENGLPI